MKIISTGPETLIDAAGRYVRACALPDGTLLAGYTAVDRDNKIIRVARYSANIACGAPRTPSSSPPIWEPLGVVEKGPIATDDIDNAFLVYLPSDEILLCAYRYHDEFNEGWDFRLSISWSDDGGKSWINDAPDIAVCQHEEGSLKKNVLREPFLRVARDGTMQAYYAADNADHGQDTLVKVSQQHDLDWGKKAEVVIGRDVRLRAGMFGVAETVEPRGLIMVFEETTSGSFSIGAKHSNDDGKTWTRAEEKVYMATHPFARVTAPQVIRVGGMLVMSFMTDEDEDLEDPTDFDNLERGFKVGVVVSKDGRGKEWGRQFTLTAKGACWPGLIALGETEFMLLYRMHGVGAVSRVFRIEGTE